MSWMSRQYCVFCQTRLPAEGFDQHVQACQKRAKDKHRSQTIPSKTSSKISRQSSSDSQNPRRRGATLTSRPVPPPPSRLKAADLPQRARLESDVTEPPPPSETEILRDCYTSERRTPVSRRSTSAMESSVGSPPFLGPPPPPPASRLARIPKKKPRSAGNGGGPGFVSVSSLRAEDVGIALDESATRSMLDHKHLRMDDASLFSN